VLGTRSDEHGNDDKLALSVLLPKRHDHERSAQHVGPSLRHGNKHGPQSFVSEVFVCPNSDCGEFSLTAHLSDTRWNGKESSTKNPTQTWRLVPPGGQALPRVMFLSSCDKITKRRA